MEVKEKGGRRWGVREREREIGRVVIFRGNVIRKDKEREGFKDYIVG